MPAVDSRVDAAELARLEADVAAETPPPLPGAEPAPGGPTDPAAELHDARTEPPPGSGEPSPEDVEQLLAEPLTEEDLRDLLELAFGLIAARRPTRDPLTGKLVWELAPDESARIAHWAAKVINKREWLRKLADFFPELMLSVTLLYAGWRRHSREQEILEALARERKAAAPHPPGGESDLAQASSSV